MSTSELSESDAENRVQQKDSSYQPKRSKIIAENLSKDLSDSDKESNIEVGKKKSKFISSHNKKG